MDLCYGLGLAPGDFSNERFTGALKAILTACENNSLACGMFGYDASLAARALDDGFDFASVGSDVSFVREGVSQALAVARGEERSGPSRGGY